MTMRQKTLLSIFFSLFIITAVAQQVKITANLDSATLLMGKKTAIHLEIIESSNSGGIIMLAPEMLIIPEVEVSDIVTLDTVNLGNGLRQIHHDVIIQSFDSGAYIIPPIKYLVGNDTIKSNELALKVLPVDVSHLETVNPIADVEDYGSKWFDFLPDFIIDYWFLILLALIALSAGIYVYVLYKKKQIHMPFRQPTPKLSPYEVAINELSSLKEKDLCSSGQEKEYYTILTDILRVYIQDRFGINALEMTTTQINRALSNNPETRSHNNMMRQILEVADFVKFAKVRPMPEDNVRSFNMALQFVEDTKPVPQPESNSEQKTTENNK